MTKAISTKNAFALKVAAITMAVGSVFAVSSIAGTDADATTTTNSACLRCWF